MVKLISLRRNWHPIDCNKPLATYQILLWYSMPLPLHYRYRAATLQGRLGSSNQSTSSCSMSLWMVGEEKLSFKICSMHACNQKTLNSPIEENLWRLCFMLLHYCICLWLNFLSARVIDLVYRVVVAWAASNNWRVCTRSFTISWLSYVSWYWDTCASCSVAVATIIAAIATIESILLDVVRFVILSS